MGTAASNTPSTTKGVDATKRAADDITGDSDMTDAVKRWVDFAAAKHHNNNKLIVDPSSPHTLADEIDNQARPHVTDALVWQYVTNNPEVRKLELGHCYNITGAGMQKALRAIAESLTCLDVSFTQLRSVDATKVAAGIKSCR